MDFHKELHRIEAKEGLRGRKLQKALESFAWNITVLKVRGGRHRGHHHRHPSPPLCQERGHRHQGDAPGPSNFPLPLVDPWLWGTNGGWRWHEGTPCARGHVP